MRCVPRLIALALTAGALLAPPVGSVLESHMFSHMLVQMPLLLTAGALSIGSSSEASKPHDWNESGIAGLLAVTLTTTFWMLPIAMDHAAGDAFWDAGKGASLVLAGAVARASWGAAPTVVKLFFAGNAISMTIIAGQLYADGSARLCNAYLLSDQAATGQALSWMTIVLVTAWAASRLWARRGRSSVASAPLAGPGGTGSKLSANRNDERLQSQWLQE